MEASQCDRSPSFPLLILGLGIAAGVIGLTHPFGTALPSWALALLGLLGGAGITLRRAAQGNAAAPHRSGSSPNAWLLGSGAALAAGWWLLSFVLLLVAFWVLGPSEGSYVRATERGVALTTGERLRALWSEHGGLLLGLGLLLLLLRVSEELTGPGGARAHGVELGVQGVILALAGVAGAGRADGLRALSPAAGMTLRTAPQVRRWLAAAGLASGLAFLGLMALLQSPSVTAFDVEFIRHFHRSGGNLATGLLKAVSDAGGEDLVLYWLPALALFLIFTRRARALRFFVMLNLGVFGLEMTFKTLVHRARPEFTHGHHFDSFPSGHTLSAVLLAGSLLWLLLPKRRGVGRWLLAAAALAWPLLMGTSRVYLGSHYLTDVLGSLFLGLAWVYGCVLLLLYASPEPAP